jgi:hypothetical protein
MATKIITTTENAIVYTAYADFQFTYQRKKYGATSGETFTPPEDFVEVESGWGVKGIKFQYSTYKENTVEQDGTLKKVEEEQAHYLILPLNKN